MADCRRQIILNGRIALALLAVMVLIVLAVIIWLVVRGSEPSALWALFLIIALLPVWPFFRKKSALETEYYRQERDLKVLEQKHQANQKTNANG